MGRTADTGRVFLWVQHLFDAGPLIRVAHLARYLASRGWDVDLVSGGPPMRGLDIGGARLHQLPPVRAADATHSRLVYVDGKPLDDSIKAMRRDLLLRLFAGADPHVLILEHFPFGRRRFQWELGPTLIAATKSSMRPAIVSSVREILVERRPEREADTVAAIEQVFDSVLVHGDPRLIGLESSFGGVSRIADKIFYTGYVGGAASSGKTAPGLGQNEILVSAGSGASGTKLAAAAADAAKTMQYERHWRIMLDGGAGPRAFRKLRALAPEWVSIEPARPDIRNMLARCALSVSHADYNTVVDILAAGARAILVPSNDHETEQALRAQCLVDRGLAHVVPEALLTPGRLASVVAEAVDAPKSIRKVKIDGEATTERFLSRFLPMRRAGARQ